MACASAFMKYHGRLQSFWREWESAHLEYTATQENHGMISILSPSILSDSLLPMKGGSRYDRFRLLVHDCESHFSQTVKEPAWKNNSSLSLSLSLCGWQAVRSCICLSLFPLGILFLSSVGSLHTRLSVLCVLSTFSCFPSGDVGVGGWRGCLLPHILGGLLLWFC